MVGATRHRSRIPVKSEGCRHPNELAMSALSIHSFFSSFCNFASLTRPPRSKMVGVFSTVFKSSRPDPMPIHDPMSIHWPQRWK